MNWTSTSEIVAGQIFTGKVSWNSVNPDRLCEPYATVIRKFRNKRKTPSSEEVIEVIKPDAWIAAIEACEKSGKLPADWLAVLEKTAIATDIGDTLVKTGRKMIENGSGDLSHLFTLLSKSDEGIDSWVIASDVTPEENFFYPTGFEPYDTWLGGLPHGLTIVAGPPGTGKTTLALRLVECRARQKKRTAYFTMEMLNAQLVKRAMEVGVSKSALKYLWLYDKQISPNDVSALAYRTPEDADLIIVDFAELMLMGDSVISDGTMGQMYQTMAWLGKNMGKTVLLLAQLNRRYDGNLPTINMIRYSGMAEALASLIVLLYNPNQVYVNPDTANLLPIDEFSAYQIIGKSRYGFKMGGVGAIQIPWDGALGWVNNAKSFWHYLSSAKVNKLAEGAR